MRLIIFLFFLTSSLYSYNETFVFKGTYKLKDVFFSLCSNCEMNLPSEYIESDVFLNVSTSNKNIVYKALKSSSRSLGWSLIIKKNSLTAEPILNDGNIVFISCFDQLVKNVPKYLYYYEKKADSLKCVMRDSLLIIENLKKDSLTILEQKKADSLKNLPPLPFLNYSLKYYSFNNNFSDKMGVKWGDPLWTGTSIKNYTFFDSWSASAVETNDTSFTYRSIVFSVDSSIIINWGTEEQATKESFNDNGVVTTNYEWRNYGLELKINADLKQIKLSYVFREKDATTTVLSGSIVGAPSDTIVLSGDYILKRDLSSGIPLLSKIPLLRLFFSEVKLMNEFRRFYIYLIPIEGDKTLINEVRK